MVMRWPLAIVAGLLLAGCASAPNGPRVMALPGSAKTADEFRSDDAACRQAAALEATATKGWRYDMTYLQCMYAKGHQIPVPGGIFAPAQISSGSSTPAAPAAPPAPAPAPGNANAPWPAVSPTISPRRRGPYRRRPA
jgi:hypothetical protein